MKNTHITHCDSGIRSGQILLLLAKGFCQPYKAPREQVQCDLWYKLELA